METKLYGLDTTDMTQEKINTIIHNKLRLESINKPLKGVSTYKMSDMDEMIRILNIPQETIKGMKKPELYNIIYKECCWDI